MGNITNYHIKFIVNVKKSNKKFTKIIIIFCLKSEKQQV